MSGYNILHQVISGWFR